MRIPISNYAMHVIANKFIGTQFAYDNKSFIICISNRLFFDSWCNIRHHLKIQPENYCGNNGLWIRCFNMRFNFRANGRSI